MMTRQRVIVLADDAPVPSGSTAKIVDLYQDGSIDVVAEGGAKFHLEPHEFTESGIKIPLIKQFREYCQMINGTAPGLKEAKDAVDFFVDRFHLLHIHKPSIIEETKGASISITAQTNLRWELMVRFVDRIVRADGQSLQEALDNLALILNCQSTTVKDFLAELMETRTEAVG